MQASANSIAYREAEAADLPALLALRNRIFPAVSEEEFRSVEGLTAVGAFAEGRAIGALPLAMRDFQLGPGESCRVAFLHAVGTDEEYRGQGIGKQMVACAKEALKNRVEALLVYRTGGERTDGYAFYQKTGFHELQFATNTRLRRDGWPEARSVQRVVGAAAIAPREAELLEVYSDLYGGFGGAWRREPGYYARALRSSYYLSRPHDFTLLTTEDNGLTAYAILGRPRLPQDAHRLTVLELAARPGREEDAVRLLAAAVQQAPDNAEVRFPTSRSSPLWKTISPYLAEEAIRSPVLLGSVLNPERRAREISRTDGKVRVKAWTPRGDFLMHEPAEEGGRTLTLGLKDAAFTRLLLRRLDLGAAWETEAATLHGGTDGDEELLQAALPAHPWIYHGLDYL